MNYISIIIGGGIGALLRYASSQVVNGVFKNNFMLGTLAVNCIGALLIGFLMNIFEIYSFNIRWKLFLIIGLLGGYTTFSAYSFETVSYFLNGNVKYAVMNIVLSNVLCLLFVLLGMWISKAAFVK